MKTIPIQNITIVAYASGLLFVSLNIADAWLTKQLLTMGWQEINPIVNAYSANLIVKALLSSAIAFTLLKFGKTNILWVLNIFMLILVLWLIAGVLGFI